MIRMEKKLDLLLSKKVNEYIAKLIVIEKARDLCMASVKQL